MRLFLAFSVLFLCFWACSEAPKPQPEGNEEIPVVDNENDLAAVAEDGEPKAVFELKRADYIDLAKRYDSLMTIHSEFNQQMVRFNQLRQGLAVYISDKVEKKPSEELLKKMTEQLSTLESLNRERINWFSGFDPQYSRKPHKEAMSYLSDQKEALQGIHNKISEAMNLSEKLINQAK